MADKIRFLTGSLTDLENKSISRGEVYFAIDGDKGKILFDAPINQTTTKRILMGGDSEHADQAEEAKYALYDKGGKDIRTYVASISLDTPGTSLIVKNGKGDTLSTLSPKFLPLTGGKITGELYTDSLTTGDLLVNGSARFVNTILGNIETADKWKTARNFITNLGSTSKAKVDGSQAEYNIGITGILPVANGGTGKNNGTDAANYFLNSLTTGSSNPVDNDYYISQYVNGGTTTTTFHRRPMSALWGYIKTKIKDVLILDETSYNGNAATADKWKNKSNFITNLGSTTKASVDGSQAEYNIGITGTLPIENGGTGATTAAKARENLSTLAALKPSGQSYYVMAAPDGSDNVWIRTTSQGLLPYQSGAAGSGHGNLGTSTWYFKDAYIDNIYGNAASATKLKTARKIITALNSESGGSFDGSADVTIGVSGTLPVSHGGTGVTSVANIQAGKDGDGNTISSTYLKLSGGTMTGNISYKGTNATNSMIRFIDNTTDTSGNGISIGGGGVTVIGAGESSQNLTPAANEESLYLLSDGSIKFYTYCDTIGNKRGVILDTSRNFYPDANNNGSVGTSSNKWASMYASTFYGNLSGTASYATRDSNGQIITDTYLTNVYVSDTTKLYKTIGTSGDSNKNILIGSFTPLDADGLINIKYLPQGALERMHIVANKAARLALTTANVQKGDTVYEDDTGSMYYVYDDTKLNSEDGYRLYSAGTATRVNWSGVQNRPHVLGSSSQTNIISLDTAKTTFTIRVVEKTGTESSYTLAPSFLPLAGGTMTGNITFADSTFSANPTDAPGISWSGGTDGAKIFYRQTANNAGSLVLQVSDDGEEYIQFRHTKGGVVYLKPNTRELYPSADNSGSIGTTSYKWANMYATTFHGSLDGTANRAINDTNGKKITETYISEIKLDAAGTTIQFKAPDKTTYTEIKPKFLPLTGGTITGELYVDGGTTLASLLVNGDARFVNTIQGSISGNAGSATKWATEKAFYIADAEAKHTSSPQVNIDGSKSSYTLHLPSTIKATLEGNASSATKLTNLTEADKASSTNTWRRVWFSYDDNVNGRPSYSDTFAYQSSTGTVKATKFQGALAGNATSADKWSTARNFITNLGSESSASVDGSTGPYNLGVTGTLPVSHGGTGNTSFTALRAIYSETTTKLSSSGHYMSSSKLAINSTSEPGYQFYVNGTSYFSGVTTHGAAVNFANNTWNLVGDDVYFGDHNVPGGFGIYGKNGNTRLDFCQYNAASIYQSIIFDGNTLYASSKFGVNGSNSSYNFYVNGTSYLNGNLTVNSSGKVKIENTTDSTYSEDTNAALDIKGGVSIDKQMSAKSVRIDNNSKDKGCTLIMNLDLNCLEFVFS